MQRASAYRSERELIAAVINIVAVEHRWVESQYCGKYERGVLDGTYRRSAICCVKRSRL